MGTPYPAIRTLWDNAWEEFMPFLDYDVDIQKVICSTNAIESLNARYRRAVRPRGHFPNEQAAMKALYPGHPIPGPQGHRTDKMGQQVEAGTARFAITFSDRMPAAEDR